MSSSSYDPGTLYLLSGDELNRIQRVMLRLFTENRMGGDEMRDAAQDLELALRDAFSADEA